MDEREVLLKLKSQWNNTQSLSSWTASTSHCGWGGITCNLTSGLVTNITLQGGELVGEVPSFICNLTQLAIFNLYNNNLTGPFPDLSNCLRLQRLNLGWNILVGELPGDISGVLPEGIVAFDVGGNNLTGVIPKSIGKLSGLKELVLDNNFFQGSIPVEISQITGLEKLTLATNLFAPGRIPPEFGGLTKLKYLWIMEVNLVGEIPVEFEKLVELEHFDLQRNNLTGTIPAGIWSFQNLKKVYMYKNKLQGGFPPVIAGREFLEIDISRNQLNGSIPEEFGLLPKLQLLYLYMNNLTGQIPVGLGNLTSLKDIRLFQNKLTGGLPPELGRHSKLWNFEVCQNQLTGGLPTDLCAGHALNSLIVFENNMNGTVPRSLGNCSSLVNIQLYENNFSGTFPVEIWEVETLQIALLHANNLSGELPDEFTTNLTRLEISNNRFSGKIPSKGRNLKVFHGSNNDFSGELPVDIGVGLPNVQELLLDMNRLSGHIPTSVGGLQVLTNMNLSNNQLTGMIPSSVGSIPVLTTLDLSNNQLSGEIPDAIGELKLNKLNLSSNSLTGEVPPLMDNSVYDRSFLSNPGLCTTVDTTAISLPNCSSEKSSKLKISKRLLIVILAVGILAFIVAAMFGLFTIRDIRRKNYSTEEDGISNWRLTSFSPTGITETTILNGLKPENLIETGGSGEVYLVQTSSGSDEAVAVKKIWSKKLADSKHEKEFEAEVQILGSIRHANIIKLLCCISSPNSKLVVYEYMKNRSLYNWLHDPDGERLDWATRVSIALGTAQGLCYLHENCNPRIVHRDVKSSNILLDQDFKPKVADFGIARILTGNPGEPESMTGLAGSFGYMAPECGYTNKLTEKVDVYGFGVVLLELTTGRKASDGIDGSLVRWVWQHFQQGGEVMEIVDEALNDGIKVEEIGMVMRLGLICTALTPTGRPSMKDVLEVLLKCEESKNEPDNISNSKNSLLMFGSRSRRKKSSENDDIDNDHNDLLTAV